MKIDIIRRLRAVVIAFMSPEVVETDALTGVLNRGAFLRAAKREFNRAKRQNHLPAILVFIDLDDLTEVNNARGHRGGDLFLKEFAQKASVHIRPYDLLARVGGDEFVLFLSGMTEEGAQKFIRRMHGLFPKFSWGIKVWDDENDDLETILDAADTEMYRMKKDKKKREKVVMPV